MDSTTSAPFDTTVNGDSSVSAVSPKTNVRFVHHDVWIERLVDGHFEPGHWVDGHYEADYAAMNELHPEYFKCICCNKWCCTK